MLFVIDHLSPSFFLSFFSFGNFNYLQDRHKIILVIRNDDFYLNNSSILSLSYK